MEQMEVQNIQSFLINDDGKVFVIILRVFTHNCGKSNLDRLGTEVLCLILSISTGDSYFATLTIWLQECYLECI